MAQIEAMLAEDPEDAFLRYGLALEHASAGDDATSVEVLRDLIHRTAANPYIPAYLMAGQSLIRLDRMPEASDLLRQGIAAAGKSGDIHAQGEMQGLLDSIS